MWQVSATVVDHNINFVLKDGTRNDRAFSTPPTHCLTPDKNNYCLICYYWS